MLSHVSFVLFFLLANLNFAADLTNFRRAHRRPNLEVIRTFFKTLPRDRQRRASIILGYEPSYSYTAPRRSELTDPIYLAVVAELTAEEEMVRASRVKSLLAVTTAQRASESAQTGGASSSEVPPAGAGNANAASAEFMQALASTVQGEPMAESTRAARKRKAASMDVPVEDLTADEATTEEPVPAEAEPWRPEFSYRDRPINLDDSLSSNVKIAHELCNALLLPADMAKNVDLSEHSLLMRTEHAMAVAIQQVRCAMEKSAEKDARLKAADTREAKLLQSLKASKEQLAEQNEKLRKGEEVLGQRAQRIKELEDQLKAEEVAVFGKQKEAYNRGFDRAEASYVRQFNAAMDIYYDAGWRAAHHELKQEAAESYGKAPSPTIPASMAKKSKDLMDEALAGDVPDPEFDEELPDRDPEKLPADAE